ncbi:hypothetical protein ANRL4_03452 [Anaerolineae bacterium]|nr:hypothetical protein ANRL4_03452 [Anaerolineae bacterium]
MKLPRQKRGISGSRKAHAPYNFVPLPERRSLVFGKSDLGAQPPEEVNKVLNRLPAHDRYSTQKLLTGFLTVGVKTLTPLYVRGMFPLSEFLVQEKGQELTNDYRLLLKNQPEFFHTHNPNEPIIPGSSLRGMVRTLVEIVSYGKITRVSERKLFFRTVDDTAVGIHYRDRMGGNVETGFIRQTEGRYFIKVCSMSRIKRSLLVPDPAELYDGRPPNRTPQWNRSKTWRQYMQVWVLLDGEGNITAINAEEPDDESYLPARLVITGDMNDKKQEFLFFEPDDDAEEVDVSDDIVDRFHDDDQITQWQQKAFDKDKPRKNWRKRDGMLRANLNNMGDPVFFLRENGQLTFFGRAGMFRLPYLTRPLDLVSTQLRNPLDVDIAEAMFGYVRTGDELKVMRDAAVYTPEQLQQGKKLRAYAGRVFVSDAVLDPDQELPHVEETITPRILATPKPTSFQHYIVQQDEDKDGLSHYDDQETVIRGHKLYWHRGRRALEQLRETDQKWLEDGEVKRNSTQHTRMNPVRANKSFTFRIYFENLSDVELGALLWALEPQGDTRKRYRHKLGMGKPLGMGSIELAPTLHITNRKQRYESLFKGDNWETGESAPPDKNALIQAFEKFILTTQNENKQRLAETDRIQVLLKMMEWQDADPGPSRDYMKLGAFKERPVLPDPRDV